MRRHAREFASSASTCRSFAVAGASSAAGPARDRLDDLDGHDDRHRRRRHYATSCGARRVYGGTELGLATGCRASGDRDASGREVALDLLRGSASLRPGQNDRVALAAESGALTT